MHDDDQQKKPISHGVQKIELKHVDEEILKMENRLQLLKEQKKKEDRMTKMNKERLQRAIDKKQDINSVLMLKNRDRSQELRQQQQLHQQNQRKRQQHRQLLEDLTKASYLVKADEAKQIKNMTIEHQQAVRNIKKQNYQQRKQNHESMRKSLDLGKQHFVRYWNSKVEDYRDTHQREAYNAMIEKQQKKRQLKELEKQQIKMLKQLYKVHEKSVDSKKDYLTALNIPASEIASLYPSRSKPAPEPEPPKPVDVKVQEYENRLKLPKTVLFEDKLRKVVETLREQRKRSSSVMVKH